MEECHEQDQGKPSLHARRMKVFEFPLLVVTDHQIMGHKLATKG